MRLKILYLILFMLMFIPIGLCEKIQDIEQINNIKIYDKNDKIISIYDKNISKSMDIELVSTISDIDKLIKIVKVTNYIEYIPNVKNDFITKTKKVFGKNDIYKIEYFIEKYNYTFDYIIINKTIFNNKTGKNETKLINKSIIKDINSFWVEFKPYGKIIFKNETFKLKIIHYKKPELGFFKIQTIPIFKNIECNEFTWWNGNWNLKRPILINNTYGDNVINYQLKSINLSQYQINASSTRIINESSGLMQEHWNQSTINGNLEYVWTNFSKINNGSWVNDTYYIYYQSTSSVYSVSNISNTFIFGDDFNRFNSATIGSGWIESHDGSFNIENNMLKVIWVLGNDYAECYQAVPVGNYIYEWRTNASQTNSVSYILLHDLSLNNRLGIYFHSGGHIVVYSTEAIQLGNYVVDTFYDFKMTYYSILDNFDVLISGGIGSANTQTPYSNPSDTRFRFVTGINTGIFYCEHFFIHKYTNNEPELWTVGNIEYPEELNMTCNLKIITHLTNKKVQIVDMNASIVNESYTNECINLSYDSYIVYMSNPVKISSFTELLNILDNFLIQALLFIFLIVIATLFYVFIQIVKKKGFKL